MGKESGVARQSAAPLSVDLPRSQPGCDCSICDTVGEPMSDKPPLPDMVLRTRIARALYGQILHPVPLFEDQPDEVKDAWFSDADAVIRELGLKQERQQGPYNFLYRYATGFMSDE